MSEQHKLDFKKDAKLGRAGESEVDLGGILRRSWGVHYQNILYTCMEFF